MMTEAEVRKAAATFEFPGYRVVAVAEYQSYPGLWGLRIEEIASGDTRFLTVGEWLAYWDHVQSHSSTANCYQR